MLHIFSGDDHVAIRKALEQASIDAKRDGTYRRHSGDVTVADLDPYFSESLFGETSFVLLDGVELFPEETRTFLFSHFVDMAGSSNTFVVHVADLPKEAMKEIEKAGYPHKHFGAPTEREQSPFAFTDAFLARDKKQTWLRLNELIRAGSAPEEVHGALFWAIKSLWLVATAESADPESLGMKPFVYQKNKRFLQTWTQEEVERLLSSSTALLERTRMRGGDLGLSLEHFVLTAL